MNDFQRRVQEGFDGQPFMKHLAARLDVVSEGSCEISVPFSPLLTQQHGFFHAGVTATLADNAGGFAAYSLMAEDEQPLTVEFKINLLEKAVGAQLIARATVLRNGRTLKVSSVEVFAVESDVETRIAVAITTVIATRIR